MDQNDIDAILEGVPFFEVCTPEQLRLLAFTCEWVDVAAGELVYGRSDVAEGAFVLVSGTVNVVDGDETGVEGYVVSGPDVILGEMALVLDRPRDKTVEAMTDLEMIFVPRASFAKLVRQFPDLAAAAAERIRQEMGGYIKALNKFKRL